jgi:transcriptional regulator with XRE-family HTH domain
MARLERPVDPADGPLPMLAHELRKLRAEAGNPTYRTLARRTGYSASTLSEAAAGRRKPTLDVLLAYVGALNGDPDEWRARWEAVGEQAAEAPPASASSPTSTATPLSTATPTPGEPSPSNLSPSDLSPSDLSPSDLSPSDLSPSDRRSPSDLHSPSGERAPEPVVLRRRRPKRVVVMAGLAVVVALALTAGTMKLVRSGEPAAAGPSGPSGCPAAVKNAVFVARTYGSGTTIRQGPARVERPLATVPPGCTIGLTGFCVGEPIIDSTAYTPDVRWFIVAGGGVLASATVHGNPPAGMSLSHCPGDRPLPTAITLHMSRNTLTAEGRNVEVVGYAAYYDGAWHQIGLTGPGNGDFATGWRPVKATVAAAACLGGEAPTGVADLRAYPAGSESRLPEAQRKAVGQVACLYPTAK